ncbi:alpha/beta hydrolase [Indioceanicola profundi]|uniref:alpha/beta hydrolase n=1 Tax=Indioceanicola profundi TaxID=2220096 RepID=UPI000E6AD784|nr:alpha/beta hydrolase [Indioceanicola profundi]
MQVKQDTAAVLAALKAMNGPKIRDLPPPEGRKAYRDMIRAVDRPVPASVATADLTAPGPAGPLPVRLYTPTRLVGGAVVVFFHGGGWVIGDLESHDGFCGEMAEILGLRVVAVDYRLAPEHPFPAAHEDCLAAARWVAGSPKALGGAVEGIALAGDSAGGNLAAATALQLRGDAGVRVLAQFLIYPATDMMEASESHRLFGEGYLLERGDMEFFGNAYYPRPEDRADPRASLIRAPDLSGLPPAVVLTCGLDPLRDEGRAFAARLIVSGVEVHFHEAPSQIHGVITMRQAIPSSAGPISACLADFGAMIGRAARG